MAGYLGAVTPQTIYDVLERIGKMQQQQALGRHAEENVRAGLLQQQLANQRSQAILPYAAKGEEAKLRELLARAANTEIETKYIPEKFRIASQNATTESGNLGLSRERYSPERLKLLDKYREALIGSMPAKALTQEGKSILEQANLEKGLLPTGEQLPQGSNFLNPKKAKEFANAYELERIKRKTDVGLRSAFPQIESIDNTLKSIPLEKISQFFGPEGQLKAASEFAKSHKGQKISKDYQEYRDFLTTKGPAIVAQMRQFLKDSITPGAQEHIRSQVFPAKWTSNPQLALNQFAALSKLFEIEKQARIRAANDPGLFQGLSGKQKKSIGKIYEAPIFKNKQQFDEWKSSASPEEIERYKQYLGG